MRRAFLTGAVVAGALAVWGFVEPRVILNERHEPATVPGLPPAWEGREFALIADLQVGMWLSNPRMIARIVGRVVERRPAALLIAGDFVYHPAGHIDTQLDTVEELLALVLRSRIPVLAVLGNHDWRTSDPVRYPPDPEMAARVRGRLERMGIRVLDNEAVGLAIADGAAVLEEGPGPEVDRAVALAASADPENLLYVVGLGSHLAGRDDAERALAGVPLMAPRIVFMHNPASFTKLPPHEAPLALAAHTHGGQLRVPFFPDWSWLSLFEEGTVLVDGWIDTSFGAPGNRLYVNRGIGFSRLPLRINAPPELTFLRLRRGPPREG